MVASPWQRHLAWDRIRLSDVGSTYGWLSGKPRAARGERHLYSPSGACLHCARHCARARVVRTARLVVRANPYSRLAQRSGDMASWRELALPAASADIPCGKRYGKTLRQSSAPAHDGAANSRYGRHACGVAAPALDERTLLSTLSTQIQDEGQPFLGCVDRLMRHLTRKERRLCHSFFAIVPGSSKALTKTVIASSLCAVGDVCGKNDRIRMRLSSEFSSSGFVSPAAGDGASSGFTVYRMYT